MTIPDRSDRNSGYNAQVTIEAGKGMAFRDCPSDCELWFAATVSSRVKPTTGLLTFGAADYDQSPTAFPMPGFGFVDLTPTAIEAPETNRRVASFYGQVPWGSRLAVWNGTDAQVTIALRWSVRKVRD